MIARKLLGLAFVATILVVATGASGDTAPSAFGPVDSRTFHWKGGTSIEAPTANCDSNIDWLLVRGAGIANAKIDVSPKVSMASANSKFPANTCTGPDCVPIYVKITSRDAPGTRTVTAKLNDGRSISTTFDVIANAGRCDYPKK